MRTVRAARYVLPLREGGSVPALVEGDDAGLWVVKLRGAAQGAKPLVAELVAGELARAAGLKVPEIVLLELDAALAAREPHPEICAPLERSVGLNVALDYLPGSVTYDPAASAPPTPEVASRLVLLDAVVANIDRTPRNPNLLVWHRALWAIDHGAALYFHHGWSADDPLEGSADPFEEVDQHVLLPWASALADAARHLAGALGPDVIARVTGEIPDALLGEGHAGFPDADAERAAYRAWLDARMGRLGDLAADAEQAHARAIAGRAHAGRV